VAPPLVKGRALVRRRVAGVVFIVVLALLVELAVALYRKSFTDVVRVALQTDRAGNQLSVHADVKVRGLVVGEVRKISSRGDGATLSLALDPSRASLIPKNVRAQLLPKTLFGEKEVALIIPGDASTERLAEGDTISQDRSSTALETETALNDLLPLLKSLQPQQLSATLNALSAALRGRGERLGNNLALNAAYFRQLNPSLPRLAEDMAGLADLTTNYSDATPDLLRTLDNLAFSGRSLVAERTALDTFLRSTRDFSASATRLVADNEKRFVALARDSLPSLKLYATYSDIYPCLLNRIAFSEIEGERTFGGAQPGLHITVEAIKDNGGYAPGDEPKNKDTYNAHCYGLGSKAIIPFPAYRNPQDGYRDSDPPESPGTGPTHASFLGPLTGAPTAVTHTRSMPRATTPLEALLLAPVMGNGV
jgi:phospholipid/cholesterol/gamma-HCH transport system substrate-binding protein